MHKKIILLILLTTLSVKIEQALALDLNDKKEKNIGYKDRINGKISTSFINEHTYESDSSDNGYNTNYVEAILQLSLEISRNLSANTTIKLEQMYKTAALSQTNDSSSFADEGIYIQELTIDYQDDNFALSAGKFNLNFGEAWNWNYGIWGYNVSKDEYRQEEKLGFGTIVKIGDKKTYGGYSLGFDVFTNDTKNLDNSIITKREYTGNSGGNSGDKRSLASYAANINIDFEFSEREKLSYHFAYLNLAVNEHQSTVAQNKIEDQQGFVANINYEYTFLEKLSMNGLLEYVAFNNFTGNIDKDTNFLNVNLMLSLYKNWHLITTYIRKVETQIGFNDIDTTMVEFSLGYRFNKNSIFRNLYVVLGYKKDIIDNQITAKKDSVVGIAVNYVKEF